MDYILSFCAAVGARIVSYFVCKWLDRRNDNGNISDSFEKINAHFLLFSKVVRI